MVSQTDSILLRRSFIDPFLAHDQSKHAKALLLQYLNQNVSPAAQFFDVNNFPLPIGDKSHALEAFLDDTNTTLTNEWSLGDKVANHILSAIRNQDRRNPACEAELKAELHFLPHCTS